MIYKNETELFDTTQTIVWIWPSATSFIPFKWIELLIQFEPLAMNHENRKGSRKKKTNKTQNQKQKWAQKQVDKEVAVY